MKRTLYRLWHGLIGQLRRRHVYRSVVFWFALVNFVICLGWTGRTYPNTRIGGRPLGNLSHRQLTGRLPTLVTLPATVELTDNKTTTSLKPAELGIQINYQATAAQARSQRSWLPLGNLFTRHDIPLSFTIDNAAFRKKIDQLAGTYQRPAQNAKLVLHNGAFSIQSDEAGQELRKDQAGAAITTALAHGARRVTLPLAVSTASVGSTQVQPALAAIQRQQKTRLAYRDQTGQTRTLSASDISGFYAHSGNWYTLSDGKIQEALTGVGREFGMSVQNMAAAVKATRSAVEQNQRLDFTFEPLPPRPPDLPLLCSQSWRGSQPINRPTPQGGASTK